MDALCDTFRNSGNAFSCAWQLLHYFGSFLYFYHIDRPDQGLDGDTRVPHATPLEFTGPTQLLTTPVLGGLHHTYQRVA